jgi:hypothetical protein
MTWREPQPTDVTLSEEALSTAEVEGEPDTIEDEFAKDDAPEQEYEDDV